MGFMLLPPPPHHCTAHGPCVVNTFDQLQAFDENFEHMFQNHFFLLFKMMYITCPEIIIFWISGWLFLLSYPTGGV